MSDLAHPDRRPLLAGRRRGPNPGDAGLLGLSLGATGVTVAIIAMIVYEVVHQSDLAIGKFGLGFIGSQDWNAAMDRYGALQFLLATGITSVLALIIAAPIAIAIGLFLADLAPKSLRSPVGAMVETLAGVPSVLIGLWGIIVLGPVVRTDIAPALNAVLGWTPFFKTPAYGYTGASLLSAVIVLVIMIVPIVSSVARELFARVPREIQDGSLALGATRWETIRKVVIPYVGPGLIAASVLGLGRALGEAIAVSQVIGATTHGLSVNLFNTGDTIASRIASQYQGATSQLQISSLAFLGLILLVLTLLFNIGALVIIRRVERSRG